MKTRKPHPVTIQFILMITKSKPNLTASARVGFHKYTFPKSYRSSILIDLNHGLDNGGESYIRIVDKNTVEGWRKSHGWAAEHTVYFVAKFSRYFSSFGTADDNVLNNDNKEAKGKNIKAYVKYSTEENDVIMVKVGISAVSLEGAKMNLEQEVPGFDFNKVKENAENTWEKELNKIVVETKTDYLKTTFYTALYHTMITPNLFNDVDGKYYGMDRKIHEAKDQNVYTVFSLWDTFRALHPSSFNSRPRQNSRFC